MTGGQESNISILVELRFLAVIFFFVSSLFSSLLAILFFLFQDNKAELIKQAPGHISRNSCTLALLVGKEVAYL